MPSVSKKQRKLMGLAEHHPEEVSSKNKGVLNMSHGQLHDFAKTKEKGLPVKVKAHGRHKAQRKESKPKLHYE